MKESSNNINMVLLTACVYECARKYVSPSPPAVEGWRWLTDSAVGRTETAAAAAES